MPIKTELWRIDRGLEKVNSSSLEAEIRLETALDQDISIVDPNLLVIGRQVATDFGKLIDLLAIDSVGCLTILELKRNKTPREVVAQILDYAAWIQGLDYERIVAIYKSYDSTLEFEAAFEERFGASPPEEINQEHKLLIVAAEMDSGTERIVNYLSASYGVPINVVFFQYFKQETNEYLSRSWLIDPAQVDAQSEKSARVRNKESWNGFDYYVSFGEGARRSWEDAVSYGFVSAGGGEWYSNTLSLLQPGSRVFVHIPQVGYVGVGNVVEAVKPIAEFTVNIDGKPTPILDVPLNAANMGEYATDPERSEYVVRVDWVATRPPEQAIWETGMFANQNSACKLRNKFTLERLSELFELAKDEEAVVVTYPLAINAKHKGIDYSAHLLSIEGEIRFANKDYPTPTSAAKAIAVGWKEVNGWEFWRFVHPESGKLTKISKLRTF